MTVVKVDGDDPGVNTEAQWRVMERYSINYPVEEASMGLLVSSIMLII
jgi:hypothetical protein